MNNSVRLNETRDNFKSIESDINGCRKAGSGMLSLSLAAVPLL